MPEISPTEEQRIHPIHTSITARVSPEKSHKNPPPVGRKGVASTGPKMDDGRRSTLTVAKLQAVDAMGRQKVTLEPTT